MHKENPGQVELRQFLAKRLGEAKSERSQAEQDHGRARAELEAAQIRLKAATDKVSYLETKLAEESPKEPRGHAHAAEHKPHAKSA